MTGGTRERTLASHSRLFRILFPHLASPRPRATGSPLRLRRRRRAGLAGEKLSNETRTRVPDTYAARTQRVRTVPALI